MMNDSKGFTLVEVMVAVGVIAIALPALLFTMQGQIQSAGYLRDKLQAQWVAENKLAEYRIQNNANGQVVKGKQKGMENLGQRSWHWETESTQFLHESFKDMYAVKVSVWGEEFEKGDAPLVTVYGALREYTLAVSSQNLAPAEAPIYQTGSQNKDDE